MPTSNILRLFVIILSSAISVGSSWGAIPKHRKAKAKKVPVTAVAFTTTTPTRSTLSEERIISRTSKRKSVYSPWTSPTFADSTAGDLIDGEDLAVRRAAVQALGPYNGSVVVVDP